MQLYTHFTANNIKLEELPFIRELSMEAYIVENSDILCLDDDDFSQVEIIEVELSLKEGRKSKKTDGRIDILSLYNNSIIGVIELKLGELTENHLHQLTDYLEKREYITNYINNIDYKDFDFNINDVKFIGVLVGTAINSNLAEKLKKGYSTENQIPIVGLTLKRYRGNDNQIYVLTETYFKNTSRNFDNTKYKFFNTLYGKGRLVLALVKQYVEDNPTTTYADLENIFPKSLHGRGHKVFGTIDDAKKLHFKRHFTKPNEKIKLSDGSEIVVCSQWGIDNIGNILKKADELGYTIETKQ